MNKNNTYFKITISTLISIVLHILLFTSIAINFTPFLHKKINYNNFKPTSTKGYTVDFLQDENNIQHNQSTSSNDSKTHDLKNNINLKERHGTTKNLNKIKSNKSQFTNGKLNLKSIEVKTKNFKSKKKTLIVRASAPIIDYTQMGSGDKTNSSTNGTGTINDKFDPRVIEYGREVAYAIHQNIDIPIKYQSMYIRYKAYIELDHNMQFSKIHVVSPTNIPELDQIIAKAIEQTVYPPIPSGASWDRYHNIDFNIK